MSQTIKQTFQSYLHSKMETAGGYDCVTENGVEKTTVTYNFEADSNGKWGVENPNLGKYDAEANRVVAILVDAAIKSGYPIVDLSWFITYWTCSGVVEIVVEI